MSLERPFRSGVAAQEAPISPEVPRTGPYAALYPRLLLGGVALNPENRSLAEVTLEDLGRRRDYLAFEKGSRTQRKAYWEGQGDFNSQMKVWMQNTVATFNSEQGKKFFTSKQGRHWAEIYRSLGINASDFTEKDAGHLYQTYLSGTAKDEKSKLFTQHIVTSSSFDLNSVSDIQAVNWIGHIFGIQLDKKGLTEAQRNVGAHEVITHYVIAEKICKINPDILVEQANTPTTQDNQTVPRINLPEENEVRILEFLWDGAQKAAQDDEKSTPKPTRPGNGNGKGNGNFREIPREQLPPPVKEKPGFRWVYERPGNPRKFPEEHLISQVLNPVYIAQELQKRDPYRYGGYSLRQLAHEVREEQQRLRGGLARQGLDSERLVGIATKSIREYEKFVESEYGIKVPDIERIIIQPISGKTVDYWGAHNAYAFVIPSGYPIIFLNMDNIVQAAARRGLTKGISPEQMSPQIIGELTSQVLSAIHPHEYNHLTGDLAFWERVKIMADGSEVVERILPGKMGLMMMKPRKHKVPGGTDYYTYHERGRGLMEAVTTEITNRWKRKNNQTLEADTYKPEREVLSVLEELLARNLDITQNRAFSKFVRAYFGPAERKVLNGVEKDVRPDFEKLIRDLSGSRQGIKRTRPHFLSIIYGLMDYDVRKYQHAPIGVFRYSTTLAFIRNSLNSVQQAELNHHINYLGLSPAAEESLISYLQSSSQQKAA